MLCSPSGIVSLTCGEHESFRDPMRDHTVATARCVGTNVMPERTLRRKLSRLYRVRVLIVRIHLSPAESRTNLQDVIGSSAD
jgi:hypothetical protein